MMGVLILVFAFGAATIQLIRSNLAKEGEPNIGGLHRAAAIILLLSTMGLVLGLLQNIQAAKQARANAENLKDMDILLKASAAKLGVVSTSLPASPIKEELERLRKRMSAPFSDARQSD